MSSAGWTHFYNTTRAARKIIVVDLGFLGDTVHLVPALRELRDAWPQAQLHVLTTRVGAEVLVLAPWVERTWVFPLGSPSPPWWKHWGVLRALRRERFDVALNFSGSDRSVFTLAAVGARHTLAYRGGRQHFWQDWLVRAWIPRQVLPTPVFEGRRHLLGRCGFPLEPARFDLVVPAPEHRWAEENVPARALHVSINAASTPLNEWPLEHWVTLVKDLLAKATVGNIIATGGAAERERSRLDILRAKVPDDRLRVMPIGLTIPQLAALLLRCRLHLGPDSGVLHLAVALGVPTLSFFRDRGHMEWVPRGPDHRVFMQHCPCLANGIGQCFSTGRAACLAEISPGSVAHLIREHMAQTCR